MIAREVDASIGQRLLWLLDHYRGERGALNEAVVRRLRGPLDRDALGTALDELVRRHESLRTTFVVHGRRLVQVVHEPRPLQATYEDVSYADDPLEAARAAAWAELHTRIDATQWPVRTRLWRLADDDHLLSLNVHHLVTDEMSSALIARDLTRLYARAVTGAGDLPVVGWQYADWSEWQRRYLEEGGLERLRAFWEARLEGVRFPALPRAADAPRGERPPLETIAIDAETTRRLAALARTARAPVSAVGLALFYATVFALTGQRALAIASLFANRTREEVSETVGFFVNMLVLPLCVDPEAPLTALVRDARTTLLGALAHQDLPYQLLAPRRLDDGDGVRADDVVFQFVPAAPPTETAAGLAFESAELLLGVNQGRFGLELALVPDGERLEVLLLRAPDRFDDELARGFLARYVALAKGFAARPDATVGVACAA